MKSHLEENLKLIRTCELWRVSARTSMQLKEQLRIYEDLLELTPEIQESPTILCAPRCQDYEWKLKLKVKRYFSDFATIS